MRSNPAASGKAVQSPRLSEGTALLARSRACAPLADAILSGPREAGGRASLGCYIPGPTGGTWTARLPCPDCSREATWNRYDSPTRSRSRPIPPATCRAAPRRRRSTSSSAASRPRPREPSASAARPGSARACCCACWPRSSRSATAPRTCPTRGFPPAGSGCAWRRSWVSRRGATRSARCGACWVSSPPRAAGCCSRSTTRARCPAETLYDLLAFARSEANLRVLLTYSENESLPGPLPEGLAVVRLEAPMNRAETQDYVKARLAGSGAPRSLADRFDSATIARLHRESAGNPLRLHGLAVAVARGAAPGRRARPRRLVGRGAGPRARAGAVGARARRSRGAPAREPAPRGRGAAAPPPPSPGPPGRWLGLCVGIAASVLLAEWRQAERPGAGARPAGEALRGAARGVEGDSRAAAARPSSGRRPRRRASGGGSAAAAPAADRVAPAGRAAAPRGGAEPAGARARDLRARGRAGRSRAPPDGRRARRAERAAAPEAPAASGAGLERAPRRRDSAKLAPPPGRRATSAALRSPPPPRPLPRRLRARAAPAPPRRGAPRRPLRHARRGRDRRPALRGDAHRRRAPAPGRAPRDRPLSETAAPD